MSIKQTIKQLLLGGLIVMGAIVTVAPVTQAQCGGVQETAIIKCSQDGTGTDIKNSGVWGVLLIAINILTAGVGVVAVGGIVWASILYTSAGGSSEQTKKAMGMITNIVIGVLAYALMYAFLNFIIPGGLFD